MARFETAHEISRCFTLFFLEAVQDTRLRSLDEDSSPFSYEELKVSWEGGLWQVAPR